MFTLTCDDYCGIGNSLIIITGDITVGEISLSELSMNGSDIEFTLSCISTGGPATTVSWTRNTAIITEGMATVLDDRVTAQYTHTLTGTRLPGGLYTCTVANNKPSMATASIFLEGCCKLMYNVDISVYG